MNLRPHIYDIILFLFFILSTKILASSIKIQPHKLVTVQFYLKLVHNLP
jgi:hypothetical protein